jgi:hypothetical protein
VYFIGRSLGEVRGRRGDLRFRACDLKLEVLWIEPCDDVAGMDEVADIDDSLGDLAGDAEAEIGLVAGPHHADELAARVVGPERDLLHLNRALQLRDRRDRLVLARGKQRQEGHGGERFQGGRDRRGHGGIPLHVMTDELRISSQIRHG